MLDHLFQRVVECLAQARSVTLATCGPAGLQAGVFSCEARGMRLYLLVPQTSDHLLNLESETFVVATTDTWRVDGRAHRLSSLERPTNLALLYTPDAHWGELVELCPIRLQVLNPSGWGYAETIDVI